MSSSSKLTALNKFRSAGTSTMRPTPTKVLVVYDVQVKTPEVSQVPLVLNYGKDFIPFPRARTRLTDTSPQIYQKPSRSTRTGWLSGFILG